MPHSPLDRPWVKGLGVTFREAILSLPSLQGPKGAEPGEGRQEVNQDSLVLPHLLVHWFAHFFLHSFVDQFHCLFTYLLTCSLSCPIPHFSHLSTHSFTHSFIHHTAVSWRKVSTWFQDWKGGPIRCACCEFSLPDRPSYVAWPPPRLPCPQQDAPLLVKVHPSCPPGLRAQARRNHIGLPCRVWREAS